MVEHAGKRFKRHADQIRAFTSNRKVYQQMLAHHLKSMNLQFTWTSSFLWGCI